MATNKLTPHECTVCGEMVEESCVGPASALARGCNSYRAFASRQLKRFHGASPIPIKIDPMLLEGDPDEGVVTRPNYYCRFPIEPIYFIMKNKLPFWAGSVIKYVCRYDAKNGLEDLKKARRYLDMRIKQMEGDKDFAA